MLNIKLIIAGAALLFSAQSFSFYCGNTLIVEGDRSTKVLQACSMVISTVDRMTVRQYGVDYIITLNPRGVITSIEQEIK